MSNKPWEGRSVWCSGGKDGESKGWIEVKERNAANVYVTLRPSNSAFGVQVEMPREAAKIFAGHLLSLAQRTQP